MTMNERQFFGFRRTRGDASRVNSNSRGVPALLVPTTDRDLHFASAADFATDWNVANPTHPTLYIHSETTPATDYVSISHDATEGIFNVASGTYVFRIDGTDELDLTASILAPSTSDGLALGSTSLMWADLFLASGAVINFNNGDVTLTHAANSLTVDGGDLIIANGNGVVLGHSSQQTIGSAAGEFQVLGTAAADSTIQVGFWGTGSLGPAISFLRSRGTTIGSNTIVQSGDLLGAINFYADDGTDYATTGGYIAAYVDGTPGANDMPGRLVFATTPDGSTSATIHLWIGSSGLLAMGNVSSSSSAWLVLDDAAVSNAAAGNTAGADLFLQTQDGGTASGNNNGVDGGSLELRTGDGSAPAGTGTTGGAGGAQTIVAGAGAAGSSSGTGGAGGDLNLTAGAGGSTSGAGTGGAGGSIILTPGAGGTTVGGTDGAAGDVQVAGGFVLRSSSATEIGIMVTNEALTVGSEGTIVAPYRSSTDAAFDDTAGGNVNGAFGFQYDSDTGPTNTLEARINGTWVSVALSGTLFPAKREYNAPGTLGYNPDYLVNPKQVFAADGKHWVDESKCFVCGEAMQPSQAAVFYANARRKNGDLHAIYGHPHLERDPYVQALEERVKKLEALAKVK